MYSRINTIDSWGDTCIPGIGKLKLQSRRVLLLCADCEGAFIVGQGHDQADTFGLSFAGYDWVVNYKIKTNDYIQV